MNTTIKATVWDRLVMTNIVASSATERAEKRTADFNFVRMAGKLVDVLRLSEDERGAVDFRKSPDGTGFTWNEPAEPYEIALPDAECAAMLKDLVKVEAGWRVEDYKLIEQLRSRLGID
jgi:hypothetical protein